MENLEDSVEYSVRCPCFKFMLPFITGFLFLCALIITILMFLGASFTTENDRVINFNVTLEKA